MVFFNKVREMSGNLKVKAKEGMDLVVRAMRNLYVSLENVVVQLGIPEMVRKVPPLIKWMGQQSIVMVKVLGTWVS
jgi:hypothetical protein